VLVTLSTLSLSLALLPQNASAATPPLFTAHRAPIVSAPSFAAQADAESINASLAGLRNAREAAFVGYALVHQTKPCAAAWPFGIEPTLPMLDKFASGCWLLQDPSLTKADVAYVLAQIPTWISLPPP